MHTEWEEPREAAGAPYHCRNAEETGVLFGNDGLNARG